MREIKLDSGKRVLVIPIPEDADLVEYCSEVGCFYETDGEIHNFISEFEVPFKGLVLENPECMCDLDFPSKPIYCQSLVDDIRHTHNITNELLIIEV